MNELYREIAEDIRRERVQKLWNSFGKIMVAASVTIIVFTAIIVVVQNYRQARAMEQTTQFIKGVDRLRVEDYKGAVEAFDVLAADESSSYFGLAMLRKAQAQDAMGDHDGAQKTYQELAKKDGQLGGLAKMLGDIMIDPDVKSPFYYSQEEWNGWQLLRKGKKEEAVTVFSALRDDDRAPYSLRERMQEVTRFITPEKSAMKDEPMNDEQTK